MPLRFIFILLLALPGTLLADASRGDFMGYQLGNKYPPGSATRQQVTTTGNLIITAEQPVKPDDIAEVSLLTTPGTLTIGSITAAQWFATEGEARIRAKIVQLKWRLSLLRVGSQLSMRIFSLAPERPEKIHRRIAG